MKITDQFVYGTQYYRAPTPLPEEWEEDLQKMGGAGLDTIQLRIQWRWNEPREDEYQFEDIDRLFDLAEQHRKQVAVKFMLETAPQYIFDKYGGSRRDMNGQELPPGGHGAYYVGGWWPCFDNPHVLERAKAFVKTVVERYCNRKSLLLWNIWNEPRRRPAGDCACSHSNALYRTWLKEKFGTVEEFNRFAGKCWDSLDSITPPRMPHDYIELFLWRSWTHIALSRQLAFFARTVKESDNAHPVITHVGCPLVQQDVVGDCSDDYLNAKTVDFYGSSFCVGQRFTNQENESMPFMLCDWLREITGGYFWIYELYPDWGNWAMRVSMTDFRFKVYSTLAAGSKGLMYWQYRAERLGSENDLAGLVHTDGAFKDITVEAANIKEFIQQHSDFLMQSTVIDDGIGILYDRDSDMISRIENTGRNLWDFELIGDYRYHYKRALNGSYMLFREAGYTCRMLDSRMLPEALNGLRLVYVPQGFMLSDGVIESLRTFADAGGVVIAEEGFALRQENTWLHTRRPGAKAAEMFGVNHRDRMRADFPEERITFTGIALPVAGFITRLEPVVGGTEVIARWNNGSPAAVLNKNCLFMGASLGASYFNTFSDHGDAFLKCISGLLSRFGITPELNLPRGVYSRRITSGQKTMRFLFNRTENKVELQTDCTTTVLPPYETTFFEYL